LKIRHLLLAISITALWGLNFSVIKLGLTTILAGIRLTLCALPAGCAAVMAMASRTVVVQS
jgi:O-acetylserine/cysteine efflux transporter